MSAQQGCERQVHAHQRATALLVFASAGTVYTACSRTATLGPTSKLHGLHAEHPLQRPALKYRDAGRINSQPHACAGFSPKMVLRLELQAFFPATAGCSRVGTTNYCCSLCARQQADVAGAGACTSWACLGLPADRAQQRELCRREPLAVAQAAQRGLGPLAAWALWRQRRVSRGDAVLQVDQRRCETAAGGRGRHDGWGASMVNEFVGDGVRSVPPTCRLASARPAMIRRRRRASGTRSMKPPAQRQVAKAPTDLSGRRQRLQE